MPLIHITAFPPTHLFYCFCLFFFKYLNNHLFNNSLFTILKVVAHYICDITLSLVHFPVYVRNQKFSISFSIPHQTLHHTQKCLKTLRIPLLNKQFKSSPWGHYHYYASLCAQSGSPVSQNMFTQLKDFIYNHRHNFVHVCMHESHSIVLVDFIWRNLYQSFEKYSILTPDIMQETTSNILRINIKGT